jgi:hypothetical protein
MKSIKSMRGMKGIRCMMNTKDLVRATWNMADTEAVIIMP